MRASFFGIAVATVLAGLAGDASAQGTKDYTGPLPPTNVSPLSPTTTSPTPNWQGNIYSSATGVPYVRRLQRGYGYYRGQRVR